MKFSLLTIFIWCGLPHGLFAAESSAVRLFAGEKQIVPRENAQARLQEQIVALVQSSNFHSGSGDKFHLFSAAGVQQDYRDVVASGEYVLLLLPAAEKIRTVGGGITVAEVVVGMRGPGGKNTVFTIDESGMLMSHAKYSGEVYLELKKTVAAARE